MAQFFARFYQMSTQFSKKNFTVTIRRKLEIEIVTVRVDIVHICYKESSDSD